MIHAHQPPGNDHAAEPQRPPETDKTGQTATAELDPVVLDEPAPVVNQASKTVAAKRYQRGPCSVCGRRMYVRRDGTVGHHGAESTDGDGRSRQCRGVGKPSVDTPAPARAATSSEEADRG